MEENISKADTNVYTKLSWIPPQNLLFKFKKRELN